MSGSAGPTGTSTADRWARLGRRVLTTGGRGPRPAPARIDGAPRWAAGLAAGAQAAVLSFAVIAAPTLAAYVATSADPSNANVGWLQSVAVAGGVWLLAHGVPLLAGGVPVTLIPLGITLLAVFCCYGSARRTGHADPTGYAAALGGYLIVVLAVVLAVEPSAAAIARAVVGAVLIGGLGLGAGLLARPEAPTLADLSRRWWIRVPPAVRAGVAAGVLSLALLVGVAAILTVGWIIAGRDTIAQVGSSLGADGIGAVVLALAQVALVPDLVGWAVAFVAGPGFAVGTGSHFTPAGIVAGPLPAVPLLGALPTPGGPTAVSVWLPLALLLVGAVAGWWLHGRLPRGPWWRPLLAAGTAAAVAGLGAATVVALASGSAGPGRMAEVGGSALLVGLMVALGSVLGLAAVVLPASSEVRAEVARCWRRLRRQDDAARSSPVSSRS